MKKGFEMVSISIDDDMEAWQKAVKEEGMPWNQVCGANGKVIRKNVWICLVLTVYLHAC